MTLEKYHADRFAQCKNSLAKAGIEEIAPKSDFTYKIIIGEEIIGKDGTQSLMTGSIFRSCIIKNTIFSRCDFEAVRVEDCQIFDTDFCYADIRSSVFSRCTFINCNFNEAFISDNQFSGCVFRTCDFAGSSITDSIFCDGGLEACTLTKSINVLNNYSSFSFEKVALADCTFSLHIMTECEFKDVIFNADAIGTLYGINERAIKESGLMYLGDVQDISQRDDIISDIIETYKFRRWYFWLGVIKLNFGLSRPVLVLQEMIYALLDQVAAGILIKRDDVIFFERLMVSMHEKEVLPFYSVLHAVGAINDIMRLFSDKNEALNKVKPSLLVFLGRLDQLYFRMLENVDAVSRAIYTYNKGTRILLKIKSDMRPEYMASEVINYVSGSICGRDRPLADYVSSKEGSFVQIIESATEGVFYFLLFLYLLEGVLVQLTRIKGRTQVLLSHSLPPSYQAEIYASKVGKFPIDIGQLKDVVSMIENDTDEALKRSRGYDKLNMVDAEILGDLSEENSN